MPIAILLLALGPRGMNSSMSHAAQMLMLGYTPFWFNPNPSSRRRSCLKFLECAQLLSVFWYSNIMCINLKYEMFFIQADVENRATAEQAFWSYVEKLENIVPPSGENSCCPAGGRGAGRAVEGYTRQERIRGL